VIALKWEIEFDAQGYLSGGADNQLEAAKDEMGKLLSR
jgi:hypothetical protein